MEEKRYERAIDRVTRAERIRAEAIAAYNDALRRGKIDLAAQIAKKHGFRVLNYHENWENGGKERWEAAVRRAQSAQRW